MEKIGVSWYNIKELFINLHFLSFLINTFEFVPAGQFELESLRRVIQCNFRFIKRSFQEKIKINLFMNCSISRY